MKPLKPKKPGILGLLPAYLLAGTIFLIAPRVMAESAPADAFLSGAEPAGLAVAPEGKSAPSAGDHSGKAKRLDLPAPKKDGSADESTVGSEGLPHERMPPGGVRYERVGEVEPVGPGSGPQGIGRERESVAGGVGRAYKAFDDGDEIIVEWVEGEGARPVAEPIVGQEDGRQDAEEGQEHTGEAGRNEDPLFGRRLSAPKASLGLTVDRYSYPDQLIEPHWARCLSVLENGSTSSLPPALNRLYEAKLDAGFRNIPDYATLLVRRAYRLLETGDFLDARLLGEAAYNLAPEYYPVSSSVSDLVRKDPQQGVAKYLYWKWISLKQRFLDFLWQFTTAGKAFALFLMALYLFFLFLGLYFLGRYAGVLLHFIHERLPVGPVGMSAVGAVLLMTVLVLFFVPGPFWVTVFVGFLSGRFVRRWEKVCYSLFLLLWVVSPWLFNETVCFFSPLSDATEAIHRCIQGNWNAAGEEALNAAVRSDPESLDLLLTKALVEKRTGDYEQALRVLKKALVVHPQAGSLWNNLGNLHAVQGDLEEAKAAYRKAVLDGNGSAAPHYNLSQLLRREFAFLKGAEEYHTARKIDAERVDYFAYIHSPNPNRFFMDEEPGKTALWRHAFYRGPETERAADDVWRSTAAGIPLRQAPWVFLSLAGVYVLFVARRRSGQEPFVCSGCGQIVCGKCDTGAGVGGICSPCYQALYQRENISKERRHGQMRKMARYQSGRSRRLTILNLLLPGLGFSLLEEKPGGMLVLFGFVFLALVAGFWSNMLPVPMTVWETGGSGLRILCVFLLLVLYIVIQKRFVAKIRARR